MEKQFPEPGETDSIHRMSQTAPAGEAGLNSIWGHHTASKPDGEGRGEPHGTSWSCGPPFLGHFPIRSSTSSSEAIQPPAAPEPHAGAVADAMRSAAQEAHGSTSPQEGQAVCLPDVLPTSTLSSGRQCYYHTMGGKLGFRVGTSQVRGLGAEKGPL